MLVSIGRLGKMGSAVINSLKWQKILDVFSNGIDNIGTNYFLLNNNEILNPYKRTQIADFGNSITANRYTSFNAALAALTGNYIYALGYYGVGSRNLDGMISDYASTVGVYFSATKNNYVIINEISNTVPNHTVEETYNLYVQLCGMCKATGYKVIAQTASALKNADNDKITSVNALIKANYLSFADYLFDIRQWSEFNDASNLTYFSDGVHWTAALNNIFITKFNEFLLGTINKVNSIKINNVQVATFNDTMLSFPNQYSSTMYRKFIIKVPNLNDNTSYSYCIDNCRKDTSPYSSDYEIRLIGTNASFSVLFIIVTSVQVYTAQLTTKLVAGYWYEIIANCDGSNIFVSCYNIELENGYYDTTVAITGTPLNNSGNTVFGLRKYDFAYKCNLQIAYAKINNIEIYFNHQNGLKQYTSDASCTGTYTRTVTNLWANFADLLEPYHLTKGVTIYTNDSYPTDFTKCILISGNERNDVITGYTKLSYYPAGSGIIKGLPNEYKIPTDADIQASGLTAGDHDFAYFDGLSESDYLKITKTTNSISKIVSRKKQ